MKYEMSKKQYVLLKEFLDINKSDIQITSVVADEQLYNMGFVREVPCIVELRATEEEIEKACEIAMDYEILANMTENKYLSKTDEDYVLFEKYGWIWDLFKSDYWKKL